MAIMPVDSFQLCLRVENAYVANNASMHKFFVMGTVHPSVFELTKSLLKSRTSFSFYITVRPSKREMSKLTTSACLSAAR